MVTPKRRSLSLPIVLSSVSVGLSIALLVGWTLVMLRNASLTKEVFQNVMMMVAGIISLVVIMTVLVLFTVFLVREIKEVRRQTSFIDSVTHELKSPLASLKLCVETMARPEIGVESHQQLQNMMFDDIQRLSSVIDGILEASRVGQGVRARALGEINLEELVAESATNLLRRRKLAETAVTWEIPTELKLHADPRALRTIFDNLLDNAIKYSSIPPQVHVKVNNDAKGHVLFRVSDQGIGISKRDMKRIFDRFFRAPEEEVRARHGTGLGLYVVAALAREMGGKIEAQSEGQGKGSTFIVTLPQRSGVA